MASYGPNDVSNDYEALAVRKSTSQLVRMVNVYTGEHKVIGFWGRVRILFMNIPIRETKCECGGCDPGEESIKLRNTPKLP